MKLRDVSRSTPHVSTPTKKPSQVATGAVSREWFPVANSNAQHFTSLLRLEDATPIADAHLASSFIDELFSLVKRSTTDSLCRVKALTIVGRIASQNNFKNLQHIVEQLIAIIDKTGYFIYIYIGLFHFNRQIYHKFYGDRSQNLMKI